MLRFRTALTIAGIILAAAAAARTTQVKARPLARQVDHIVVESDDPKQLFEFLTGTLRLPVASPLRSDGSSVTAGVGLGNASIELFRPANRGKLPKAFRVQAHFTALAFEPYQIALALTELKARGIPFSEPQYYSSTLPNGTRGTLSTTLVLPEMSSSAMSVFLFEYSLSFLNVHVRRRQWAGELALNRGGPLGIESLKEIVIGTTRLPTDKPRWRRFLLPVEPAAGNTWRLPAGPAIRLISGGADGILHIVLKVKSLEEAREFLKARRWLGSVSDREVSLAPSAVQGLDIRLAGA